MIDLELNYQEIQTKLVEFLSSEVKKTGHHKLILGLSGGIDSAVVCFLAAQALGPENIQTFFMPYKTSNKESEIHARLCAKVTGVELTTIPITPMIDAYFSQYEPEATPLRKGNKMARERMTILYDQSAKLGGLVIGTSNKSEFLLGYGTQYGDTACAINPIGDLYKTQIFQLAKHLNVPAEIINKAPSADLWAGQADEKELGFTYKEVDQLLYLLIEKRKNIDHCRKQGFSKEFIEKVLHLIKKSSFKRRLPLLAAVTKNTIGSTIKYPK